MAPDTRSRIAAFLVLGLVLTSMPARVWLFGACPICGQIHVPILVAHLGEPQPPAEEDQDRPHDGDFHHDCFPPFPFCPTALPAEAADVGAVGELRPHSDPPTVSLLASALIRPPRA